MICNCILGTEIAFEINRNKILFTQKCFNKVTHEFTGSYTEDEPNFPWQNNLIILQKKVSGIHKVVNFKDFSR